MGVSFVTFCCPKDIDRLHAPKTLENMVESHKYWFDDIIVIHQRCQGIEYLPFDYPCRIVESESHPNIFEEFNINDDNPKADELTHGPTGPHYWKYHVMNHLIGLKESTAEWIVFSDCDCTIKSSSEDENWIELGIDILERYPEILIVSPGDGGQMFENRVAEARLTQNISQQLFLCNRERLRNIDFDMPWNGQFDAPAGPFPEYYFLLEGRMGRYMTAHNLWRAIVPDSVARYWHWQWH